MTVLWRIGATLTRKAAAVSRSVGNALHVDRPSPQIANERRGL
jgi:hypothetical protein